MDLTTPSNTNEAAFGARNTHSSIQQNLARASSATDFKSKKINRLQKKLFIHVPQSQDISVFTFPYTFSVFPLFLLSSSPTSSSASLGIPLVIEWW
jgi:hypothetical protein